MGNNAHKSGPPSTWEQSSVLREALMKKSKQCYICPMSLGAYCMATLSLQLMWKTNNISSSTATKIKLFNGIVCVGHIGTRL